MSNFPFTILLSASIPTGDRSKRYDRDFSKIKNAQVQIEEAIVGLSRNIFQKKGRIIFGGHPSISPLVAMVAGEFRNRELDAENQARNENRQKPIMIFQSRAFEKVIPEHTTNLLNRGDAAVIWTEVVDGEEFDKAKAGQEQCLKSLELMRRQMMDEDIDALVCMGGMEGVEREFHLFRDIYPYKPVYILETTGGASSILAEYETGKSEIVKVTDRNMRPNLEKMDERFELIPYAYITALIIEDLQK